MRNISTVYEKATKGLKSTIAGKLNSDMDTICQRQAVIEVLSLVMRLVEC